MAKSTTARASRTAAEESAPAPIPAPTVLYHQPWFPASVVLPGENRRQRNDLKVFVTDAGLFIYDRVPVENPRQEADPAPAFFSPIVWEKTRRPATGIRSLNGISLVTEAGTVTLTPMGGGCCSLRDLRDWFPTWANRIQPWPGGDSE